MNKNDEIPLVPRLRFPKFADGEEWTEKELGKIAEIVRGGSPRPIQDFITTDYNGLNWLKIADVSVDTKYITATKEKVIREAINSTREVNPGDLILSNSMSFGRPYILKIKTCIHDGWIAIRNISNETFEDFLYYYILSDLSQRYFETNAAGAAVKNLNADIIKLLPIILPKNISEQQKIADCLSSLDELITAETQKLDILKDHKKGLLQNLFPQEGETVPRQRFKEFENAGEWEEKILGEILKVQSSTLAMNKLELKKSGYAVYGADSIIGYIDKYQHENRYISVVKDGSGVGRLKLCEEKSSILGTLSCLKVIDENINDLIWSFYLLNRIDFSGYIKGAGIPHIYYSDYKNENILAPKLHEQQKIALFLSSLDELITAQSSRVETLKLHKRGLLQGLLPNVNEIKI